MKQLAFKEKELKAEKAFGSTLMRKAKNRGARPISTKQAMHVVLRSSQAVGEWSFKSKKNAQIVSETLKATAKKYGVKVYSFANVGNHLHIVLRLTNRQAYRGFIRALTGTIAIKVSGANKLNKLKRKFWDYRPFTRVLTWGRDFSRAIDYIWLNQLESWGVLAHSKGRLKDVVLRPFD